VSVNINDAFPSKYLKASDLKGAEPVVTIAKVEMEAVGRDREMKAVVYFQGKEKGVVLNKTNSNKIAQIAGSFDTDDWAGVSVKLYATETEFGGETVECIRIKPATVPSRGSKPVPAPKPAPPPQPEPTFEAGADDVPF
jgi:hypothetical protein